MAYNISVWVADMETILVGRAGISIAPFAAVIVTGNAGLTCGAVVGVAVSVVGGVVGSVVGGVLALVASSAAEVPHPVVAISSAASSSVTLL
jgi:hypothetical protein